MMLINRGGGVEMVEVDGIGQDRSSGPLVIQSLGESSLWPQFISTTTSRVTDLCMKRVIGLG